MNHREFFNEYYDNYYNEGYDETQSMEIASNCDMDQEPETELNFD